MAAGDKDNLLNLYAETADSAAATEAESSDSTEQKLSGVNEEELLGWPDEQMSGVSEEKLSGATVTELSAAQRARMERQRQRARVLRDARLVQRPHAVCRDGGSTANAAAPAADSGGGFILEDGAAEAPPLACPPPAPIVDPAERPHCLECERVFAQSYLFDAFGHAVCDDCRDDEETHALITRTEAKSAYILKDCDLDLRPPALRFVRRRNPHGSRLGDMRLYLRAQVAARALLVWGSAPALRAERERRGQARARGRLAQTQRRLRALRMDVRSSLYDRTRAPHEHAFGAERYDAASDQYERACACGHVEIYEKM